MSTGSPPISRAHIAAVHLHDALAAPLDRIFKSAQEDAWSVDTDLGELVCRLSGPALSVTAPDILFSRPGPESTTSRKATETLMRLQHLTRTPSVVDFFTSRGSESCLTLKGLLANSLEMALHPDPANPRMIFTLDDIATILESLSALDDASEEYKSVAAIPSWDVGDKVLRYIDETMEKTMLEAARARGIDMTQGDESARDQFLGEKAWRTTGDKLRALESSGVVLGDTTYASAVAMRLDEIARSRTARDFAFNTNQKEVELHDVDEWRRLTKKMLERATKKRAAESMS